MQHPHHPVTRLQIVGFLATTTLLCASICTAFIFSLLGNLLEALCGVLGVILATWLCRMGRKRWNFDAMDSVSSMRNPPAYAGSESWDRGYNDLANLIDEIHRAGWQNLDLEGKADARNRLNRILEKEPMLAEEVLAEDTPEHLRYVARKYLPAHSL